MMRSPPAHRIDGRAMDELIFEEIDGELDDRGLTALQAHVRECATCAELRSAHRRTHDRMAGPITDRGEIERARAESLRRIRVAGPRVRRPSWVRTLVAFPAAAALVLAAVLGIMFVRTNVASPSYPDREVVTEATFAFPGGRAVLTIEQGSRYALPGEATGVLARADLRFDPRASGSLAEIRIREVGQAHGILARAPDLTGATRQTLESRLPNVYRGETQVVDVWVHLEPSGFDSEPIVLELTYAAGGGTKAIARTR